MAQYDPDVYIHKIIAILQKSTKDMVPPASTSINQEFGQNPFLILVSCILSLRTRDAVSLAASKRLFAHAKTPEQLAKMSPTVVEKIIYPVGFYRQKAQRLVNISAEIITTFHGTVPHTLEELMSFKGVGLKTATLVLAEGFNIPALCVDTHVHKISNRLGLVATKTPEQTEAELKKIIPQKYWIEINRLFVMWGQNVCVPVSPFCSKCPLASMCPKVGVTRSR